MVVYSDAQELATLASPSDLDSACVLPAVPIEFRRFLSLPTGSAGLEALRIPEHQRMSYFKVVCFNGSAAAQSTHQLLGHELNLQQSDMQLECQLASHGLYCGDSSGYKDPRRKELESGAGEWRLLFQMDSDDDLNVMWGDCGMLYFWIRKADLRCRYFDKTWTILQCH